MPEQDPKRQKTQSLATSPVGSGAPSTRSRSSKLAAISSSPGKPTTAKAITSSSIGQPVVLDVDNEPSSSVDHRIDSSPSANVGSSVREPLNNTMHEYHKPLMQLKVPAELDYYGGKDSLTFTVFMKVYRLDNCFVIRTSGAQSEHYAVAFIEEGLLGDFQQEYEAADVRIESIPNVKTIVPVFSLKEISVSAVPTRFDGVDAFALLSAGISTTFEVAKASYERNRTTKFFFNTLVKVHSVNKSLTNLMDIHGNLFQVLFNLPEKYAHLTPTQAQVLFFPMLPYDNAAIKITTPDFIDASRPMFINIHSFFPDHSKEIVNANYNIRDIAQSGGFSADVISIGELNTLRKDWPGNTSKRYVLNSVNLDAGALADLQNFEEKDCSYVGCHKCGSAAFGVTEAGFTIQFCRKCKKSTVSARILRPSFTVTDDEGNEIVMSVFANHIADIMKLWDSYDEFKSLIDSYSNFDFKDKFLGWLTSVSTEDFFKQFTEEFVYNFVAVNKFDLEVSVKSANGTAFVSITRVRKSV